MQQQAALMAAAAAQGGAYINPMTALAAQMHQTGALVPNGLTSAAITPTTTGDTAFLSPRASQKSQIVWGQANSVSVSCTLKKQDFVKESVFVLFLSELGRQNFHQTFERCWKIFLHSECEMHNMRDSHFLSTAQ